ncbi:5265_t:CDS:2 [Ambispora gerdemannii]|uniref:5265_t:CDS:1 n=1 Tax=Ambispora gerdemannii TaxID=144530 RepID=A0A9N8YQY3_9GLOM|nr:5265_t:CDS:2 [Ambispora gerdemannii]
MESIINEYGTESEGESNVGSMSNNALTLNQLSTNNTTQTNSVAAASHLAASQISKVENQPQNTTLVPSATSFFSLGEKSDFIPQQQQFEVIEGKLKPNEPEIMLPPGTKILDVPSRILSAIKVAREKTDNKRGRFNNNSSIPKRQLFTLSKEHIKGVNAVKWCGEFGQVLASASMDGTVRIWDVFRSKECIRVISHDGAVKDIQWNSEGKTILSCGYEKLVKLTDLETGATIQSFLHPQFVTSLRFNPSQSNVFVAGMTKDGLISWDVRANKIIKEFRKFWGSANDLEFFPDGSQLLTCSDYVVRNSADKNIVVWDVGSATAVSNQIYQEAFSCTALRIHSAQKHFVAQSNANYIAIFRSESPWRLDKRKRFEGHLVNGHPIRCNFSLEPDNGRYLVSGDSNGAIFFYDWSTSKNIKSIENAHQGPCTDVSWHPVLGGTVASCGWDGRVLVWG